MNLIVLAPLKITSQTFYVVMSSKIKYATDGFKPVHFCPLGVAETLTYYHLSFSNGKLKLFICTSGRYRETLVFVYSRVSGYLINEA